MSETRAERAASAIWQAWSEQTTLRELPGDIRPRDIAEGYAAQAALETLVGPQIGWKLAATSEANQHYLGIDGPMAGRLFAMFFHNDGDTIASKNLNVAVVEPEFAFRLAVTLQASTPLSLEDVRQAIEAMYLAIEIPESRFENHRTAGAPQLLADSALGGHFVLGCEVPQWLDVNLETQAVHVSVDDELVATGNGMNGPAHPLSALTWLANELGARGRPLQAGELVTTGTATAAVPIGPGARVNAVFDGLGEVRVSFEP